MGLAAQPIFLVDAFDTVVVYYTAAAAAAGLPFPPPHGSALRRAVAALRAGRAVTPRLLMLREGGGEDVAPFTRCLIEDEGAAAGARQAQQAEGAAGQLAALQLDPAAAAGAGGGGGGEGPTLVAFLEEVQRRAAAMLRPVN